MNNTGYTWMPSPSFESFIKNNEYDNFISEVGSHLGVTIGQIKSRSRKREYVVARQIAMYLIRKRKPNASLKAIGKAFDRDHSTVINAIDAVSDQLDVNKSYRIMFEKVENLIQK